MKLTANLKLLIFIVLVYLFISYIGFFILDEDQMIQLGQEDGLFEYLTFLFFSLSGFLFLKTYSKSKNIWFLLLGIFFFFGAGEEISWGQRIFSFTNPEIMEELNVQNEFNIHNIEFFNTNRFDGSKKADLSLLFTINFLFKLFWLSFAIILPLVVRFNGKIKLLTKKVRLPIPPLGIGLFFLINWLVSRIFIYQEGYSIEYYQAVNEIKESGAGFVFFILAYYFFINEKSNSMSN